MTKWPPIYSRDRISQPDTEPRWRKAARMAVLPFGVAMTFAAIWALGVLW